MKKMNLKRGFTLIELLVVVAIIGILASVVLASLNSARAKGADAAVKANLSGMRASAELWYDTPSTPGPGGNNTYTGVCASASVLAARNSAASASGTALGPCVDTGGLAWAASTPLKSNPAQHWCVDSAGTSRIASSAVTTTVCPT